MLILCYSIFVQTKRSVMSRLQERIESFNRAFEILSEAVNAYKNNSMNILTHMALIQSFEVCFELAWKVLKDYLDENGVKVYLPKEVIKEAFSFEVISNGQLWIDMLNARNSTSHEYNLDKVNSILMNISGEYFQELLQFKDYIKEFHA